MYKTFLKSIKSSIDDNLNYKHIVESHPFSITTTDKNNKVINVSKKIDEYIRTNTDISKLPKGILPLIADDTIAAIQYMGRDPGKALDRRKVLFELNPKLHFAYIKNLNFALYYIIDVLHYQLNLDPEFKSQFANFLSKNLNLIPSVLFIVPRVGTEIQNFCDELILSVIDYFNVNKTKLTEDSKLFSEFIEALEYRNILKEWFDKDIDFKELCREFYKLLKPSKDNQNTSPKKISILNISLDNKALQNHKSDAQQYLSKIENIINEVDGNEKQAINDYIIKGQEIKDINMLKNFKDKYNNIKDNLSNEDEVLNCFKNISSEEPNAGRLADLIIKIKKSNNSTTGNKPTTGNIRGKKMFKLAKAYTRYYIKNMLPNMLKYAGNDPEVASKVIKVSTDEIQDLMYGDTMNHPENLVEVNNPAVRDQISFDVEQAVKGDQIPGGAADGMSIEDIAKKWSEIYKQVPYEHLLEVLKTQEQAGSIVEQEHTDNLEIAKEIARDHLVEAPDYYTHLEDMEQLFPAENVSERPLPEPEGMDLQTLENPLPKNEEPDHVCDGSCGGNCKCHHDKVQTVEDKLQGLNGDGVMVIMIEETPEVQEEQPLEFIQQIAAKMKR